ncbi:MAG TPA: site-2 protease family protein [Methanobacterium sp.]|nr:site-2 protease family protein [Methanobacterium sp.]
MVKFTAREIRDIIISMVVISFVFAYIIARQDLNSAIVIMPVTFVVVGLAFVLHEMAHKYMAIGYGYWAEYRMWVGGLLFALVTAYFGFVFAAPGAVYIHGNYIKNSENGKISIAGPLVNIILVLIFLLCMPLFSKFGLENVAILGATVNSFLAFFNLIPFSMLDGAKVFRWNPIIWIAAMGIAVILLAYTVFGIKII